LSAEELGGKAAWLEAVHAAGALVPRFAVLPVGLESACVDAIQAWLIECELSLPVAVRSSANVEDHGDASYAGMFETRLGVASPGELADAVTTVARSASSERVIAYRASRASRPEPRVRVVVQEMVYARSAGVCLVRPVEAPESIRVEAVSGLGQLLVSGDAEPDVFVLGADNLAIRTRRHGEQYVEMAADGSKQAILPPRRRRWKVSDAQVHQVATLAQALDRHFCFDAGTDLEWAFDGDGRLFVLQLRPLAA